MFKTIKKYLLLVVAVLALVCSVAFAACSDNKGGNNNNNNGSDHECQHVCPVPECGKCTDNDCTEPECEDKCPGNHEPGGEPGDEHECQDECPTCHKCTTECTEPECEDKCPGNHEPEDQGYELSLEEPAEDVTIGDEDAKTKFYLIDVEPGEYTVTLAYSQSIGMATVTVVVGETETPFVAGDDGLTANITIASEEYIEIYADSEVFTPSVSLTVISQVKTVQLGVEQVITIPASGTVTVKLGNSIPLNGKYLITLSSEEDIFTKVNITVKNGSKTVGTYSKGTVTDGVDGSIYAKGFTADTLVFSQSKPGDSHSGGSSDGESVVLADFDVSILITERVWESTLDTANPITVSDVNEGVEVKISYGQDVNDDQYKLNYEANVTGITLWIYDSETHYTEVTATTSYQDLEITVDKAFGLKVVAKTAKTSDYNLDFKLTVMQSTDLSKGPVEGQYTTATLAYVELDEKDSKYVPYDALLAGEHTFKTNAILITVPSNTDVIDPMYEIELGEDSYDCVIIFYSWGYGMFKNGFGGDAAMYDGDMIPFAPTSNCDLYLYNPSGDTISFTLIDLKTAGGGGGLTPEDPKEAHVGSDSIKNMTEIYFVFTATQDGTFTFKFAEGASNSAGVTFMAKSNFDDWTGSTMYAPYYEEPYTREVKAGDKVYFIVNYYQYGEAPATVSFEISIA